MPFLMSNSCRRAAATAAILTAAGMAGSASADDGANYLTGHLGWNTLERWPVQVDFGGPRADGVLGLDKSYHLGFAAGRERNDWRYELEYQRGRIRIESLALGARSQAVDTDGHYDTVMLNGYRKYQASERFSLFAGLGIGWGKVSFPQSRFSGPGGSCNCFPAAHDDGFVYEGRIGAEFALVPNQSIYAMYTRLHLDGLSSSGMPSTQYEKRWLGAVSIGYRHTFR